MHKWGIEGGICLLGDISFSLKNISSSALIPQTLSCLVCLEDS